MALIKRLPIYESDFPEEQVFDVGRKYQRSSYDTCYLLLAKHNSLPLATLDGGLKQACVEAGVELLR